MTNQIKNSLASIGAGVLDAAEAFVSLTVKHVAIPTVKGLADGATLLKNYSTHHDNKESQVNSPTSN